MFTRFKYLIVYKNKISFAGDGLCAVAADERLQSHYGIQCLSSDNEAINELLVANECFTPFDGFNCWVIICKDMSK